MCVRLSELRLQINKSLRWQQRRQWHCKILWGWGDKKNFLHRLRCQPLHHICPWLISTFMGDLSALKPLFMLMSHLCVVLHSLIFYVFCELYTFHGKVFFFCLCIYLISLSLVVSASLEAIYKLIAIWPLLTHDRTAHSIRSIEPFTDRVQVSAHFIHPG